VAVDEIDAMVRAVNWELVGADPEGVASALRRLWTVRNEQDGDRTYAEVLNAIGHNHSGWLYDAAGPAAEILATIVREADGWARRTTLEILIDCLDWARPEQRYVEADGTTRSVRGALQDAVSKLKPLLQAMATDPNELGALSKSATDLLRTLEE
jgi:hypothetical protein